MAKLFMEYLGNIRCQRFKSIQINCVMVQSLAVLFSKIERAGQEVKKISFQLISCTVEGELASKVKYDNLEIEFRMPGGFLKSFSGFAMVMMHLIHISVVEEGRNLNDIDESHVKESKCLG